MIPYKEQSVTSQLLFLKYYICFFEKKYKSDNKDPPDIALQI